MDFVGAKLAIASSPEEHRPFVFTIPSAHFKPKCLSYLLEKMPTNPESMSPLDRIIKSSNPTILEDLAWLVDNDTKASKQEISNDQFTTSKHIVTCHYPVQFEALRVYNGICLRDYISSLSASEAWSDNSGGKTNAVFTKTSDQRFVFKEIERKEFSMLLDFLPEYFKYVSETHTSGASSLLIKIFGVYEIVSEKRSKYLFAMENLFLGMSPDVKVYDLKGSQMSRYTVKKGEERTTLLDTNYKIDRNGEPLPIKAESYKLIDEAINKDTHFLAKQKKMDYSLLVIYDEKEAMLRMGIIDFLRDYDLEKHIEYYGKKLIKGNVPTTTPPDDYKNRFRTAMSHYFITVPE